MVADWNDRPVADVQGRDETVAIAAAVTWMPTLLDEVARLRSLEQQVEDMIARGDKEALWVYLVAAAKAHDGQQEGGDESHPATGLARLSQGPRIFEINGL